MSFRDIAKGGWNPKGKDGGKESWRDMAGINQVAGLMGKGKPGPPGEEKSLTSKGLNRVAGLMGRGNQEAAKEDPRDHRSTPLSALKDPSSFAPPPKHSAYYGGPATPGTPRPTPAAPNQTLAIQSQQQLEYEAEEQEEEETPKPSGPYRANTTGLTTDHLPPPPVRRMEQTTQHPSLAPRPTPSVPRSTATQIAPKPKPPPRLPPRQNSRPDASTPLPPPVYARSPEPIPEQTDGYLNKASSNRLANAGVSVPGLDISRTTSPQSTSLQSPPIAQNNQLSELQSRFSRMGTTPSNPPATVAPSNTPTGGTTWAQKQHAAQTAAAFHKDPTKLSFSDAKSALSTANNFRERHSDKVTAGFNAAKKYGNGERIIGSSSQSNPQETAASGSQNYQRPTMESARSSANSLASSAMAMVAKKPPPPPPKKKNLPAAVGQDYQPIVMVDNGDAPPPIPLSSKPR